MSMEIKNVCEPCLRENKNVKATFFCKDCLELMCSECSRQHLKFAASTSHTTFEIGKKEWFSQLTKMKEQLKCPDHESEEVKYLCKNHDKLCCNQCAIATHRKCESVVSLSDERTASSTPNDTRHRLEDIYNYSDKLLAHEQKYRASIQDSTEEIKKVLIKFKTDIDEAYDRLQKKVLQDLTMRSENLIKTSKSQEGEVEELKADMRQLLDTLDFTTKFGKDVHTYIKEKELKADIIRNENSIKKLHREASARSVQLVEQESVQAILESLSKSLFVDEIVCHRNLAPCPGYRDFKTREAVLLREIDVQEGDCTPMYCIWVGQYIVVSLHSEQKLKLFDSENGKCVTTYPIQHPWAMAVIRDTTFAVMANGIEIMKVNNSGLQYISTIRHGGTIYAGLTFNQDEKQLLVMSTGTGKIIKLYENGTNAGEVPLDHKAKEAVKGAYSFTIDNTLQRFYMSSRKEDKLCAISESGDTLFEYDNEGLKSPFSVITDFDGNIYIASTSGHCIQQIDKNGVLVRNLISSSHGIYLPHGLCFNDQMTKFAVTCRDKGKELKIYQFE